MKTIKHVAIGEFFKLPDKNVVYVRDRYCPEKKKYACHRFDDVNAERHFKGEQVVDTEFEF